MPLVKYNGNADPGDGTSRLQFESTEEGAPRVLVLGGAALELSDEELSLVQGRFQLEEVDESGSPVAPAPQSQSAPAQSSPAAGGASSTPAPSAQPAASSPSTSPSQGS